GYEERAQWSVGHPGPRVIVQPRNGVAAALGLRAASPWRRRWFPSGLLGEHVEAGVILALARRRVAAERLVLGFLVLVGFRLLLFLVAALLTIGHGVLPEQSCEAGRIAWIGASGGQCPSQEDEARRRVE